MTIFLLSWLQSLFAKGTIGILTRKLATAAAKAAARSLASDIMDRRNQKAAYRFVRELHAKDGMSGAQKAREFNRKMAEWSAKCGKRLASSVVNCLREMAVNAMKDELKPAKMSHSRKARRHGRVHG
jgi:hypothetical protein